MGYLYIDESIAAEYKFILCACVYCSFDCGDEILNVFSKFNLSDSFEYKSRLKFNNNNNNYSEVRLELIHFIYTHCKISLVILPVKNHENILDICIEAIKECINDNNSIIKKPLNIYFDEGMRKNESHDTVKIDDCTIFWEQNSKTIRGIQLADLVANNCLKRLKISLSGDDKQVKAPKDEIYNNSLSFELWAHLRYRFFTGKTISNKNIEDMDQIEMTTVRCSGLHIDKDCDDEIKNHVNKIFGTIYLGCIH